MWPEGQIRQSAVIAEYTVNEIVVWLVKQVCLGAAQ